MKTWYKIGISDAAQEENLIRQALSKIKEIRNIRNEHRIQARNAGNKETIRRGALMKMLQVSAQTLPLFVSKIGETTIPPLCGAIQADSNYVAKPGDMVAALVKGTEEDEDNWILAEVVLFHANQNKYEVDDIDEEQKDRHIISKNRVIPLPLMRANPETDSSALFPVGTLSILFSVSFFFFFYFILRFFFFIFHVLYKVNALYPQTTCFYKAIINELPQTATEDYELLFEDPGYENGLSPPLNIPQRYVIAYKQNIVSSSWHQNINNDEKDDNNAHDDDDYDENCIAAIKFEINDNET